MEETASYPQPFQQLLHELRRLPGIGPRSAERLGLWLISNRDAKPEALAEILLQAKKIIHPCPRCGFFTDQEVCVFCRDERRASHELCVVEQATDILAIEKTGTFRGRYHALGGRLSPLDHIGPEDLRIGELVERVQTENPSEVILALSADVEGEATTSFLTEQLKPLGIPITRIAHGLPAGGGLEQVDQLTLQRAFSGRRAAS